MKNMEALQDESIHEIINLVRSITNPKALREALEDYHDHDISDALELLSTKERLMLYQVLGIERTADVISYLDEPEQYISEINIADAARIIAEMDADDAVDLLDEINDEYEAKLLDLLSKKDASDIKLIQSYNDDEVGSMMTTNYLQITKGITIKQAMKELIRQSKDIDNIDTLYVVDENNLFYGEISLRDLIRARADDNLEDLIMTEYPVLYDRLKVQDCLEDIKDYAEQSLPVINIDLKLLGIITAQDIIERVEAELSEDYVKLGGLSSAEDLDEPVRQSVKKRLPWLCALLVLGMLVSSVVGIFEGVVDKIAILVAFQSLVLDMAGNVGTQSLAVTIRVLMSDEVGPKDKMKLIFKEIKVGLTNGLVLGIGAFLLIGLYIMLLMHREASFAFAVSACVGAALLTAMLVSSLVGTVIPITFQKLGVDPAVASGPFITTVNDLVAVVSYYGLCWLLLIKVMHFA
ncbi:MAG: magnesium transporter [Erysipelotrichaceae bacterium]|nr:magnesium transporter [Erysipelotrichaceae bacterium]